MTLVNELHPQGQCVLMGYGDDESYLLLHGVETEVHVKRALSYLGETNFKIVFDAADLALLSDEDYKWAAQLLQLGTIEAVKKHLIPKKKSTTVLTLALIAPNIVEIKLISNSPSSRSPITKYLNIIKLNPKYAIVNNVASIF